MVHSWVSVGSASTSSVRTSARTYALTKSGRDVKKRALSVTNWKFARGVFFLFAFLILFSGFTLYHTFASSNEVTPASGEEFVISVDSGDSLWQIAKSYKKDSMDTRYAVHEITERNGLISSEVTVGQALIIPAEILQ
ncbi:LysM peptidoglycan-binding domain-containing protein [Cohnella mopanensis]|uniref:LysM peptidoglycan-binding domain-containing protein n=1 Tax=Cohnella mopanensis TaxID=2911966 RepID=UPI001EF77882|nr:LysM peptidoglycan-binding domain-containing protein [Cohnella mopanensis]